LGPYDVLCPACGANRLAKGPKPHAKGEPP
jgi:hypothetical protein